MAGIQKGKKALFYQNNKADGYYTTFSGMTTLDGVELYNTKIGCFKNVHICTMAEFTQLTKRVKEDR